MDIFNEIANARKQKEKSALCLIVQSKGSTPGKTGAKMIVYDSGRISGTIGGGNLEKKVIENALKQIEKNEAALYKHDLLHQHNMCCGGNVEIYIEPLEKMKRLYVFGAGHVGNALARLASPLDFDIYVIDDRKEYIDQLDVPGINKMNIEYQKVLHSLPFDENTYIVILTYEHAHDREILAYCVKQPHAYLGMIGSKRKVALTKKMFTEGGIAESEALEQVDMPVGIDIHAEGPDEIAISILAKLIEVKNA